MIKYWRYTLINIGGLAILSVIVFPDIKKLPCQPGRGAQAPGVIGFGSRVSGSIHWIEV
jgi:hypothetical protein